MDNTLAGMTPSPGMFGFGRPANNPAIQLLRSQEQEQRQQTPTGPRLRTVLGNPNHPEAIEYHVLHLDMGKEEDRKTWADLAKRIWNVHDRTLLVQHLQRNITPTTGLTTIWVEYAIFELYDPTKHPTDRKDEEDQSDDDDKPTTDLSADQSHVPAGWGIPRAPDR